MIAVDTSSLSPEALAWRWREIDDAHIPEGCRAEIDEFGELTLAPLPTNRHQRVASWLGAQLQKALGGEAIFGLAIQTKIGVRVLDVCWTADTPKFLDDPATTAPEICIEVASPGNTTKWLVEKSLAYLEAGAQEAVIVELGGRIRYFTTRGEHAASTFNVSLSLPD